MKIELLVIGKTDQPYLQKGIAIFQDRLKHYTPFDFRIIPDIKNSKNLSELEQKKREGELILKQLQPSDELILLDENGKQYSSVQMANTIEKKLINGTRKAIYVIGGPYGFSDEVYQRANEKVSLSPMTFSHQMVRLIFVEQLYRAFTIIKGEPYHHI